MSGRGDGLAVLLILALGFLADGIMEAAGPGGFVRVSLVVLALAVALRSIPKTKEKGTVSHQPTKALRYQTR